MQISEISALLEHPEIKDSREIRHLCTDSRRILEPQFSVFIALRGENFDGHDFILAADAQKTALIISERAISVKHAIVLIVPDSLEALRTLARFHLQKSDLKQCLAITGSSGKTTLKEWLAVSLQTRLKTYASPHSYNSQIGVPLSVWGLPSNCDLGIFEAGISRPGEMNFHATTLQPEWGILSNFGVAHQENFKTEEEHFSEKMQLFGSSKHLILQHELHQKFHDFFQHFPPEIITWSLENSEAQYFFKSIEQESGFQLEVWKAKQLQGSVHLPFDHPSLVETACGGIVFLSEMGVTWAEIAPMVSQWKPLAMRLEWTHAPEQNLLFNDTYNFDLTSIQTSLNLWSQKSRDKSKITILSDGIQDLEILKSLYSAVQATQPDQCYWVGNQWLELVPRDTTNKCFPDTESLLHYLRLNRVYRSNIFLKGSRKYAFDRVSAFFTQMQSTELWVNLEALAWNYHFFKKKLKPQTGIMCMVKAGSYGLGSSEVAKTLENSKCAYLGVAFTAEGVSLREQGIQAPIMVLHPDLNNLDALFDFQLEPVIYSRSILKAISDCAKNYGQSTPVHIEVDTGMNRLGFRNSELTSLAQQIDSRTPIRSIFSHLASAEDPQMDSFSKQQNALLIEAKNTLEATIGSIPIMHIANSAGAIRHPEMQHDLVRIGIGLYGIGLPELQPVIYWKSTISQIREVEAGEPIGYGGKGTLNQKGKIAILPVGYADGFNRGLGHGVGQVHIQGKQAPTVGAICMDMCMIDVTHVDCQVGDIVELMGSHIRIETWAKLLQTIPYEVLTMIGRRNTKRYIE